MMTSSRLVLPTENPFTPFRIASFEPTLDSRTSSIDPSKSGSRSDPSSCLGVPIQSTKASLYPPVHFRPPGAIALVRFIDEVHHQFSSSIALLIISSLLLPFSSVLFSCFSLVFLSLCPIFVVYLAFCLASCGDVCER